MSIYDNLDLPPSVLALMDLRPAEDIALAILRPSLEPDVPVVPNIETQPAMPYVLVRRLPGMGDWPSDQRGFYDRIRLAVHVYAEDPDGDMKAAVLSEAIRKLMHAAWQSHWSSPDLGTVTRIIMTKEPTRMSDWATSTGPVQYADLPRGTWRYESHYNMTVHPPA